MFIQELLQIFFEATGGLNSSPLSNMFCEMCWNLVQVGSMKKFNKNNKNEPLSMQFYQPPTFENTKKRENTHL